MMLPLNDDDTSIESEFICIFNDGKKMLLNDLIFGHQQTSLSDVTVIEKKEREEDNDEDIGSRLEAEKCSGRIKKSSTYCCLNFPMILCYPPTFPNLV